MHDLKASSAPLTPPLQGPLTPQQAAAVLERADELASQGEYDQASAVFRRVVGNGDPQLHVRALLGLADARYRVDDEEGALQSWIVATQAPENPETWRAWVALAGARVRQGDLAGAARAYREAERRAPAHEQPAIASRLGWLSKEMGQGRQAQRYFGRARAGGMQPPTVTYAILAVTVAIGITQLTGAGDVWAILLGLDKEAVNQGEWYRLVTVTLVHGGLLHLAFNMYALYLAGPIVEALYGRALFAAFYLLTAAAASTLSWFLFPGRAVGASGAVFGLFGILFVANAVHKPALGRQARALTSQIGILIAFNLILGFGIGGSLMGGRIDNAAHIGGLLAGAWLGLLVAPRGAATLSAFWQRARASGTGQQQAVSSRPRVLAFVAMAALIGLVVLALVVGPLWGSGR